MATETSDIKVEDQTNNNNDADETEIKTASQDLIYSENQSGRETNDDDSAQNGDEMNAENDKDRNSIKDENDDEEQARDMGQDESMDDSEKTNLIINYLPQNMTDEEFKELFSKFGTMKSWKVVRNRMTGYSYGFGFVDYETNEQALKAIDELNGRELDTKKIKVAFARPAGQDIKQANLYVKNIPPEWSQDDVRKNFEAFGDIIQVRVLGNNRGVAFVLYDLRKQAEEALTAMQGKTMEGAEEPLEIKFAADMKSEKKRSGRRGGRGSGNGGGGVDGTGRTRERGNRGGVNRNRNRSQSDNRHRSQGARGTSNQRGGGNRFNNFNNNNNNSNNSNDNNSGSASNNSNNGFGPIRQQSRASMNRFAPFVPVHQQPQIQQAAPMAAYGYPPQAMYPYMMQQQPAMMPFTTTPAQPMSAATMTPMGQYQMAAAAAAVAATPQMAPISYGAPAAATAAQTMTNMYSMASSQMQNAAQLQPQLGQPMSNQMRGGAQSAGGSNSGGSSNDGVTLFVYNIGPQSDESELRSMFAPYGQVLRCNVVRKTPGGETKGFGFVTLKDRSQANAAISNLNGSPRNGKTLQVSLKK